MAKKDQTIVILSGGLDSTTLLYHLRDSGHDLKGLTLRYGQRHDKEIKFAKYHCELLSIEHKIIDLNSLSSLFSETALTNSTLPLPSGEYATGTIENTTVPNRNMIFLSIAMSWAIQLGFANVAFGAHRSLTVNYPDCTPQFANAMDTVGGVCDWEPVNVLCPFVSWTKAEIVKRGLDLQVPFNRTWSCYEGQEVPCGECSTCIDRIKAFETAGVTDPLLQE